MKYFNYLSLVLGFSVTASASTLQIFRTINIPGHENSAKTLLDVRQDGSFVLSNGNAIYLMNPKGELVNTYAVPNAIRGEQAEGGATLIISDYPNPLKLSLNGSLDSFGARTGLSVAWVKYSQSQYYLLGTRDGHDYLEIDDKVGNLAHTYDLGYAGVTKWYLDSPIQIHQNGWITANGYQSNLINPNGSQALIKFPDSETYIGASLNLVVLKTYDSQMGNIFKVYAQDGKLIGRFPYTSTSDEVFTSTSLRKGGMMVTHWSPNASKRETFLWNENGELMKNCSIQGYLWSAHTPKTQETLAGNILITNEDGSELFNPFTCHDEGYADFGNPDTYTKQVPDPGAQTYLISIGTEIANLILKE